METRTVVRAGVVAAFYAVLTVGLAPLSYGPIQFRASEALKPLALLDPLYALAFAIGTGLSNLISPFGFWDWFFMPLVDCGAALICYAMRSTPLVALTVQALIISAGVALFPLGFGMGLPFLPTFIAVATPELILIHIGYQIIWRQTWVALT